MAKMFILAVFCVCFISVSFAQNLEPKFIVTIGDYDPPRVSIGKGISKCYATALSDRYVVTTASCVKSIQKLTSVSLFSVSGAAVVSQQVSSFRSFIHPNFTEAKPYENNVALITMDYKIGGLLNLNISSFTTNSTYDLYGWGSAENIPRRDPVTVYSSSYCNPQNSQVLCSTISREMNSTCTARAGSPLIRQNSTVGILLGASQSCNEESGILRLNYISLEEHKDWIDKTMTFGVQPEPKFIVAILEYSESGFKDSEFRCYATIITKRHVLTTATCIQSIKKDIAISVQSNFPGGGGATTTSTSGKFIHPDFDGSRPYENNLAIVLLGGEFGTPVPRNLGSLKADTKCSLFGWGGAPEYPQRHEITVLGPSKCEIRKPNTFCSKFQFNTVTTCGARPGSIVTCSEDFSTVDGILLGNISNCTEQNSLEFISVIEHKEWIDKVSGTNGLQSTISLILLTISTIILSK